MSRGVQTATAFAMGGPQKLKKGNPFGGHPTDFWSCAGHSLISRFAAGNVDLGRITPSGSNNPGARLTLSGR
jgi:hypothetical protein